MAKYKFKGRKTHGDTTARLVLEGSTSDPKRYVDRDGEIELTDEEVESLRKNGYDFHKVGESEEEQKSASGLSGEGDNEGDKSSQSAAGEDQSSQAGKQPGAQSSAGRK